MKTQITVDHAGRVLIPKAVREELQLRPGDVLELQSEGEDITIRPQREKAAMVRKKGVWVFRGSLPGASASELVDEQRAARTREILGSK